MDFEDEGIAPGRIEVGGLHDPPLDGTVVEGRIPPDLLDLAELPVREQVLVQRRDATHAATPRAHRDLSRRFGAGLVEREAPVVGDAEGAAAIRTPVGRAPQILRQHFEVAVERGEADLRVPLVVVLEVDPASVGGPHRVGDAAVETARKDALPAPVQVHHLEPAHLVGARAVLVAHEGDLPPVGRDRRISVRSGAVGERPHLSGGDRDDVEFRVPVVVDPVVVPVRREDEARAVRGPRGGALVLEVARRHLRGRASLDRDDEEVVEAEVEIADAVLPVLEAVLHDGRIGPLRPGGRFGRRGEARRRIRDELVEREVAPVRRPAQPARRFDELRERGFLARVHPAHVDLAVRPCRRSGSRRATTAGIRPRPDLAGGPTRRRS